MDEIKQQIRVFLCELLPNTESLNLVDETRLHSSGLVDSMGMLRLIGFVEETFNIEVQPYEADEKHFDRIEDIAAFVRGKLATLR